MKIEAKVSHIVWSDPSKPTDMTVDVDTDYVSADYDSIYDYVRQELESDKLCPVHSMIIDNADDIIDSIDTEHDE